MTIGERIKMLRRRNDLTQEKLAEYLSVSSQAVSKWECGLACPDLALIVPLTRILHVSADELLGGNDTETNARRAELDERCENNWKYDQEEMYQMAQQAVREYPGDYKYLQWLANMEFFMAYDEKYKEDPELPYSPDMFDRSIRHSNIVIEECTDAGLREKAIWNAMLCYRYSEQYDEAIKYAEMFPEKKPITRDRAMEVCLRDERLLAHRQKMALDALGDFCMTLMEIYRMASKKEPDAMAALDAEEAVLQTVFPDGKYLLFHWHLCCVYEKRTELEINAENFDKAMEYLKIMIHHAKMYAELSDGSPHPHTCGIFNRLVIKLTNDSCSIPIVIIKPGTDFVKPFLELVKDELMTENKYAPLRDREDFRRLMESF